MTLIATAPSSTKNGQAAKKTEDSMEVASLLAKGVKLIGNIYSTYNYEMFNYASANRETAEVHIEQLIDSFDVKYLIVPIIVNEHMEIIDGQHRFEAAKKKGFPVYFIINKGYGILETQLLNTTQKNWSVDDFANFYCKLGKKDYIQYREFRLKYNYGHMESLAILLNTTTNFSKIFREGSLTIKNLVKANSIAERIQDFSEYYKGYRKSRFVFAMITLFKNPQYDHTRMLHKMAIQQRNMVDCTTVENYVDLLEEIFNYKGQGKKVRFRD